jgi:hypothetical protein
MKINLPERYRQSFVWVLRLAKSNTSNEPKVRDLLDSLEARLSKGDEKISISEEDLNSMYAPVARTTPAFPQDTEEQQRKDALHVCRLLMDPQVREGARDKSDFSGEDVVFVFQKPVAP